MSSLLDLGPVWATVGAPATFAFYRAHGDWQDRIVRTVTRSPYSHAELLGGPLLDRKARCVSASRRDGNKVRVKCIMFQPGHWDFLTVPIDGRECWRRAIRHVGAPYDVIGAVLTVTPIATNRRGLWFCSELLGHAADIPQPHTLTPGDLAIRLIDMGGTRLRQPSLGGATH